MCVPLCTYSTSTGSVECRALLAGDQAPCGDIEKTGCIACARALYVPLLMRSTSEKQADGKKSQKIRANKVIFLNIRISLILKFSPVHFFLPFT